MRVQLHDIGVCDIPVARRKRSAPAKQRESDADEGAVGGGGVLLFDTVSGRAHMGRHMRVRLHNIDVGDIPLARRKRSAPEKQRESVADEGTVGGGGVFPFGGVIGMPTSGGICTCGCTTSTLALSP
ncbi:hypothetical protein CLM76_17875 [Vreelandella venusta]|nr:hypothetical protein CLM76_17875 [Halomonas hydrothermalis]